jgi:hypothetical protein
VAARPQCAGELKSLGDYITGYGGGVPVIVIRNEAGRAAFSDLRHLRHPDHPRRRRVIEKPWAPRGEAQVLLCCSVPAGARGLTGGVNPGLVLDL